MNERDPHLLDDLTQLDGWTQAMFAFLFAYSTVSLLDLTWSVLRFVVRLLWQ